MIDFNISQIEVQQFATSDKTQQYMAAYEGRLFEISESVAKLILAMQELETLEEVVQKYKSVNNKQYSKSELETIIDRYIVPILNAPKTPKKHPFLFNIELLSQSAIGKFSNVLKIVFLQTRHYGIIVFYYCFGWIFYSQFHYVDPIW
jgi:hypothetical protein